MVIVDKGEWDRLWAGVCSLSDHYQRRLVFIGGVAVYLHVKEGEMPENFIELSHDADFYISRPDFSELRDIEDVTQNQRLHKYQLRKNGVEFDVYLDGSADLIVPYVEVATASEVVAEVRVACLEHLLLLKLDAFRYRRESAKGKKDERDLIRILFLLSRRRRIQRARLAKLDAELVLTLESLRRSSEFMVICGANAHKAKKLRDCVTSTIERVKK